MPAGFPAEIGETTGLPKSSVHQLCTTLVEEGYFVCGVDEKRLAPSSRLMEMAFGLLTSSHRHITRHQVLTQLSEEIGETVNLVVPEKAGMTCLERVETSWPLRIQLPTGTHVPFHCTASGKVFLASIPRRDRRGVTESLRPDAFTSRTIEDLPELMP